MLTDVYYTIDTYFDSPTFTKTKNTSDYSIWMCKIYTQLSNTNRYLICLVSRDVFFIGDTQPLKNLKWSVFQTRSLSDNHPEILKKHTYRPKQGNIYSSIIELYKSNDSEYEYKSIDLPLTIALLRDDKSPYNYPDKGTLNAALETYNAIIVI